MIKAALFWVLVSQALPYHTKAMCPQTCTAAFKSIGRSRIHLGHHVMLCRHGSWANVVGMEERYLLPLQPLFPFVVSPQQDTHVGWNRAFDKANASISCDLSAAASRTACWCVYAVQLQWKWQTQRFAAETAERKRNWWCCVVFAARTFATGMFAI